MNYKSNMEMDVKTYAYDAQSGLLENGVLVLQLVGIGCSAKFVRMAYKELVNKLNGIEQGKEAARKYAESRK